MATATTGLVGGLVALVALRLAMGLGESTFYPSALSLLSRNVPPGQRARATAVMQFGSVVGPALGTFVGGLIMVRYGWRAMFIAMGTASLVWLVFWLRWMRRPHAGEAAAPRAGEDPPYWLILRQRALWGGMLGTFCGNYAFYFVFSWLPLYLVNGRGLSLATMTEVASAFYVVDGVTVLVAGLLLDRWVTRGTSFNRAYKTALACSSAGVGLCLIASSQFTSALIPAELRNSRPVTSSCRPFKPVRRTAGWTRRTRNSSSAALASRASESPRKITETVPSASRTSPVSAPTWRGSSPNRFIASRIY